MTSPVPFDVYCLVEAIRRNTMSESDSSNSADFSNISFASEDSDGSFSDAAALCYEFEPEYTEEELKKIKTKQQSIF